MTTQPSRQIEATRPRRVVLPLVLLLAARLVVGWLYTLSVPVWEADNEDGHFAYARYIAQHHTLLNPSDPEAAAIWERIQPPLYYMVVAVFLLPFGWQGPFVAPDQNPYFGSGVAGSNYALHPPVLQGVAYTTALAVGVARDVGVVISVLGVLFVFLSARRLWPRRLSLVWAATCLVAFWPQFLFTGSMVSNDVLVAALSAAFLYAAVTLVQDGLRARSLVLLGVLAGAALVTKTNAFALLPAGAAALALGWRPSDRSWRQLGPVLLAIAVSAAAVWLVVTQGFLSTHVFKSGALSNFWHYLVAIGTPQQSRRVFEAARYIFRTFLASYGWGNLETYGWVYLLWTLGFGLAALGWIVSAFRRGGGLSGRLRALLWVEAFSFAGIAIALAIVQQNIFVPGRYLLPALPAVIFLLLEGWQALVPARWRAPLAKVVGVGMVLVGSSIPLGTLIPIYAFPQPPAPGLLQKLQPPQAVLGDSVDLLGALPAGGTAGQGAEVTLCWQTTAPVNANYTVQLDVVGPDGQGYGGLTTYPGHGNYATSFWRVNSPFCENYIVPVGAGFPAPAVGRLHIGLVDASRNQWLPLTQLGGQPYPSQIAPSTSETGTVPPPNSDPLYALVKIKAAAPPSLQGAHPVEYHFGQQLVLQGYALQPVPGGQPGVNVLLQWRAATDISGDYVVFVHLRDTPAHAYAQGDSQPRGGWYPTQWWSANETVVDEHAIALPAGTPPPLDLYVGVYDRVTGVRLPVSDAQGRPVVNNEVILAQKLALP
jgi:hypothetical protein